MVGTGVLKRAQTAVSALAPLALLAGSLALGASSANAIEDSEYGLAISSSFNSRSVVALAQGTSAPPTQAVTIFNTGQHPAQISFAMKAPSGIKITPTDDNFTLEPDGKKRVSFGVSVDRGQPPGEYPIIMTAQQTNVPIPTGGATGIAPGVGARLTVKVTGKSAQLTVRAINAQDQSEISGNLKIMYLPEGGLPFTVQQGENVSQLNGVVSPGKYRAAFSIPGLVGEDVEFAVKAAENKTVEIPVRAVTFVSAGLNPTTDDGKIVAADLLASVRNSLPSVEGPVTFVALVTRNGELINEVELQTQPSLPNGVTSVRESYRPSDGFTPGEYVFDFKLRSPKFEITADQHPKLTIADSFPWLTVLLIVIGLFVLLFLLLLLRRRRQRKAESSHD